MMLRLPCRATFIRYTADNPPPPINELSVRRAMRQHGLGRKVVRA